jgi:hypothetical protein
MGSLIGFKSFFLRKKRKTDFGHLKNSRSPLFISGESK